MAFNPSQSYGRISDTNPVLYVQGGVIYKSTDLSVVSDPTPYIFTTSGSPVSAVSAYSAPGVSPNFTAASLAFSDVTPTTFFDPTASAGAGTGTLANPYYNSTQVLAAITGDMKKTILGFKRGTTYLGAFDFSGVYSSDPDNPFMIVPYGSASALPIIDAGVVVAGATINSGVVWQYTAAQYTEIWQASYGKRLYTLINPGANLAAKLVTLNTAGAGYCFWDTSALYFIPYGNENPNLGQMYVSSGTLNALVVRYANVSATGNIVIAGIQAMHAANTGIAIAAPATSSSIATIDNIQLCGNRCINTGTDITANSGANLGGDSVSAYGLSDTIRITNLRISGHFDMDIGNNSVETGFTNGAKVLWNYSNDCIGHGIVELWQSNSNALIAYCQAQFPNLTQTPNTINGISNQQRGNGILINCLNAASSQDNTNTQNNTVAFCLVNQAPRQAIQDAGQVGGAYYNNTFLSCLSADFTTVNLNAATLSGATITYKNNINVDLHTAFADLIQTTTSATLTLVADYNLYSAPNRTVIGNYAFNYGATQDSFTTWKTRFGGIEANSRFMNAQIEANGMPRLYSPAFDHGVAISGYFVDLNGKPLYVTPIGCYLTNWS